MRHEFMQCLRGKKEEETSGHPPILNLEMARQMDIFFTTLFSHSFLQKHKQKTGDEEDSQLKNSLCGVFQKDFTLTNVQPKQKIMEIKLAIEKLKGFKKEV